MKTLTLLVGAPGSGKSTYCSRATEAVISQDQFLGNKGKFLEALNKILSSGKDCIIDRCHINQSARKEMIDLGKAYGYDVKCVEIKTRKGVCIQRALARKDHQTITKNADAVSIVTKFFNDYQKPSLEEGFSEIEYIVDETPEFKTIDLSNLGRPILVIGDIHGCYTELVKLIEQTKTELNRTDIFVLSVGDVVDKGPENLKCLQLLMDMKKSGDAEVLQGNHENRFRRYLIGNPVKITYGLDKTVEELETTTIDRQEIIDFIGEMPTFAHLPGNMVACHAGVDPRKTLRNQSEEVLLYARFFGGKTFLDSNGTPWFNMKADPYWLDKTIIFGHWVGDDTTGMYQLSSWEDKINNREVFDIKPNKKSNVSEIAARGSRTQPENPNYISLDTGCVVGGLLSGVVVMPDNDRNESWLPLIQVAPRKKWTKEEDVKHQDKKSGSELINKLFELSKEGLLSYSETKTSDGKNLILFNYTEHCTYERAWNEYTLAARGTIYEKETGIVHAKAFPKFFNLGENHWTMAEDLPFDKPFRVFEKMDGSLGLIYKSGDGKFAVSTRGSFYSEQSKEATKMLANYNLEQLNYDNVSLLVEIIYPENRIQVNYGDRRELVLLGGFDNENGRELDWESVEAFSQWTGIPLCPTLEITDLKTLLEMKQTGKWDKEEGWVVHLSNGTRVKIKTDDYMRIAKVKAHLGPLAIWESMVAGRIQNYLEGIPEELRPDAESIFNKLNEDLQVIKARAYDACIALGVRNTTDKTERKDIALKIQKSGLRDWIKTCMFATLSGRETDSIILKYLRPDANRYIDIDDLA